MPRMDFNIPDYELQRMREDLYNHDREIRRRVARFRDYSFVASPARDDESDASPFRAYDHAEGPAFPHHDRPERQCPCWWSLYLPDGCPRCRPGLWAECGCGNTNLVGAQCRCYQECGVCGAAGYLPDAIQPDDADFTYCGEDCVSRAGYSRCEYEGSYGDRDCDSWLRDSNLCESHRPCECGSCYECHRRTGIRNYSYKPDPVFHGQGPLFLGLECEINTGDSRYPLHEISQAVLAKLGNVAYLKSDSSIGTGFEMVTHPMSYQYALEQFPWEVFPMLTGDYGVEDNDDCGIHVHVSRDGFAGPGHLYRWQKFIYRNRSFVQGIARRRNSTWAKFTPEGRALAAHYAKEGATVREYLPNRWDVPARYRGDYMTADRYSAINHQNAHTLEVRVFAGSVKATEVQAALGLVHGSVEYTRTLDTQTILKKEGWGWQAFAEWTSGQSRYQSLNTEIERIKGTVAP